MEQSSKTILIIEDQTSYRSLLAQKIEKQGLNVIETGNGWDAWDLIQDHSVDLIVLDIILPGASGLSFLERLHARDHRSGPPVLVLSTLAEEEVRERMGPDLSYRSYIEKTDSMDVIVSDIISESKKLGSVSAVPQE